MKRSKIHTFKIKKNLQEDMDNFTTSLPAGERVVSTDVGDGVIVIVTEWDDQRATSEKTILPKRILTDLLDKGGYSSNR